MQRCTFFTRRQPPKRYEFWQVNWDYFFDIPKEFKIPWHPVRRSHDDMRDVKNLLSTFGYKASHGIFGDYATAPRSNNFLTSRMQQCMVKFHYSNKLDSHRRLLREYMTQQNKDWVKEKPELFGNTSLEEYKQNMVARNYRFIISPETQLSVEDLQMYTKLFVDQLEQQLHHKVYWQAAVHTDTEHPHVHLLINGKDRDGNMIRKISPGFIKTDARKISSEILTNLFGERTQEQIDVARNNRVYADRYTEYDDEIASIQPEDISIYSHVVRYSDVSLMLQRRLEHLKDLDLADFRSGIFFLKKGWQDNLRALGRYNTFLDAQQYLHDLDAEVELYTADKGTVRGTIRHIYRMNDEDVWNHAVVIEDEAAKKAYYVPLYREPDYKKWRDGMDEEISAAPNQKGKLTVGMKKVSEPDIGYESQFEI